MEKVLNTQIETKWTAKDKIKIGRKISHSEYPAKLNIEEACQQESH